MDQQQNAGPSSNPFWDFLGGLFQMHQQGQLPTAVGDAGDVGYGPGPSTTNALGGQGAQAPAPPKAQANAPTPVPAAAPNPLGGMQAPQPAHPKSAEPAELDQQAQEWKDPRQMGPGQGTQPQQPQRPASTTPGEAPPLPPTQALGEAPKVAGTSEPLPAFDVPHDIEQILTPLDSKYGLPEQYLARTAKIESGFKRTADNGTAQGPFQFVPSTAKKMGLKDPFDWNQSADAAARLAKENMDYLQSHGIDSPTGANLYLAHQQGAGGALALLQNPNLSAAEALQKAGLTAQQAAAHIKSNGGDPNAPAADFVNLWDSKFNGGGDFSHVTEVASNAKSQIGEGAHPALQAAFRGNNPLMALALMQALAGGAGSFRPVSYDPRTVAPPAMPWQNVG